MSLVLNSESVQCVASALTQGADHFAQSAVPIWIWQAGLMKPIEYQQMKQSRQTMMILISNERPAVTGQATQFTLKAPRENIIDRR